MSMCCIFGVCIPYSSLIPILMMLWRPLKQWFDKYFGTNTSEADKVDDKKCSSGCCEVKKQADTVKKASKPVDNSSDAYFTKTNKIKLENDMDFEAVIASEHPTCVKFTASWCKPCKQQEPEIVQLAEAMATEGSKMRFLSVDVDEHDELFASLEIVGIPHIRIYQSSEVVDTFTGRPTDDLVKACHQLSKKTK